jgi:hypothetical protein
VLALPPACCSLKNKLGQALTVLRMYHHKVCNAHSVPTQAGNACTLGLHIYMADER